MSTMQVVAYIRANKKGEPQWSEDCVCQDPVYPSDPDGSDSDCVSMAVVREADALAAIKAARVQALEWKDVRVDGLPPCDGETVYVGENEAGYLGCFNELAHGGHCLMQTAEGCDVVMSELRYWRLQDRPIRRMGEEAGRGES